jgi:S1-C subfamily serine protease
MHWFAATVLQSLIFGLGHLFGLMHSGVAFVIGVLITLHYAWRKTLAAPIFVHAGINAMSALAVLLMMQEHANGPFLGVVGDPKDAACVVREVVPDSPAYFAGLRVGDVVTSMNGQPIRSFPHFVEALLRYRPSDAVSLTVERNGSPMEISVTLERRGENR